MVRIMSDRRREESGRGQGGVNSKTSALHGRMDGPQRAQQGQSETQQGRHRRRPLPCRGEREWAPG